MYERTLVSSSLIIPSYFPIYRGMKIEPTAQSCAAPGSQVILLVEDEMPLRMMVQGILEREGFTVVSAGTAAEALAIWAKARGQIDLLLTDIVLPDGMAGWELAARLKADKANLKVLFTSGHNAALLAEQTGPLIEGSNFLAKPYRPKTLIQTVRDRLVREEN